MDTHMHICEFVSGYTNECLEAKQPCDLVICFFGTFSQILVEGRSHRERGKGMRRKDGSVEWKRYRICLSRAKSSSETYSAL